MAERETDFRVDLDLVDAFELIFDRVFGGDDLDVGCVDLDQGAVERGRFSGAGWAGDEHDAVRQVDELAEGLVGILLHADLAEVELHRPLVQNTHDDAFAVNHGNHGNADVDLAAVNFELHAAVLRQSLFGNVQPRHDLEAAHDRGFEAIDLGRDGLCVQDAVDAIADGDAVVLRLNVHVARSQVDGFHQDFVDEANDRGFLGLLGKLGAVGFDVAEQFDTVVFFG